MASHRPPRVLAVCDTVYGLLLRACPAQYRREYGPAMAQAFRDLAREAYGRRGTWGILLLWLRTLPDACSAAIAEYAVALKERSAVATAALAAAGGQGTSLDGGGTPMRRKTAVVLMVLVVAVVAPLTVAGVYTPAVRYESGTIMAGGGAALAAQAVEDALLRARRLPLPGTGLVQRQGSLEWENVPETASQILEVRIQSVQLVSSASLLASLIDDDAAYRAQVDATVVTSNGRETTVSVLLWDWGLLTPWSFRSEGDGLKPVEVRWT